MFSEYKQLFAPPCLCATCAALKALRPKKTFYSHRTQCTHSLPDLRGPHDVLQVLCLPRKTSLTCSNFFICESRLLENDAFVRGFPEKKNFRATKTFQRHRRPQTEYFDLQSLTNGFSGLSKNLPTLLRKFISLFWLKKDCF